MKQLTTILILLFASVAMAQGPIAPPRVRALPGGCTVGDIVSLIITDALGNSPGLYNATSSGPPCVWAVVGGSTGTIASYTVATLPASPTTGTLAQVTDASVPGNCNLGGGSNLVLCRWTGSTWVPIGGGLAYGSQTINGTVFPSYGLGANSCATTGNINGITNLGDYPPGACYGYAQIDHAPALFTNASAVGTGSIVVVNAAMATQISTNNNQFLYNGQIATPHGYSGNLPGALYGLYHETDHNGTGILALSTGVFATSYDTGNGTITINRAGYFEGVNDFYVRNTTGTITNNYGIWVKSGANHGTNTNDKTIFIDSPYTGGTFGNGHIGLAINDQTHAGGIAYGSVYAIQVGTGNNVRSGQLDWGANDMFVESTTSGFLKILAPTTAYGSMITNWPLSTQSGVASTIEAINALTSQRTETGADANLLTFTPAAQTGSYRICFSLDISAASAATVGWTATWTDSNGTAQTPTNFALNQNGTAAPALTFTTSAAGDYQACQLVTTNNSGTAIVVKTTFSGTSMTAKASASIERLM